MTTRRSNGEGGLSWNEARQRWVGRASLGYNADGKRRIGTVSARTKTEAKNKLRALLRDHDDGLPTQRAYTVGDAVENWLVHGLVGRDPNTVANRTSLARTHVIPGLGKRQLAELTAEEVDRWLAYKATTLATDTLQRLLSILRQSIRRAQARDLVKRNVALLCDLPKGQPGRPSNSLTREQAERLLRAANDNPTMNAYVVVSLLTGARTEELRALTWSRVNLDGNPPTVDLWRSVRAHGDTKTSKSRRTLELPTRSVEAQRKHRDLAEKQSAESGRQLEEFDLVFSTTTGTPLDPANVRRAFDASSLRPGWTRCPGHRESCGTASYRCCPAQGCRSRTSPTSSAMSTPGSPNSCTARSSVRCSPAERSQWMFSFPTMRPRARR
jgi:integrase